MSEEKEKAMSTDKVKTKIDYDSGKKDSKGDMLIDTTERVEVTATKSFGKVKKGDKINVHPTMKAVLKKKGKI